MSTRWLLDLLKIILIMLHIPVFGLNLLPTIYSSCQILLSLRIVSWTRRFTAYAPVPSLIYFFWVLTAKRPISSVMKKRKCVRRLDNPIVHLQSSCKSNIQIVYLILTMNLSFKTPKCLKTAIFIKWIVTIFTKGGFKSEDTGEFLHLQDKYSKSLSWAENLNKLFTDLGGKFKFSA